MDEATRQARDTFLSMVHAMLGMRHVMRREFEAHGCTGPQFRVLELLYESDQPGMKLSEIGDGLHVTCGNVTSLIDRLEASGWVERRPHQGDRRSLLAVLTPEGRELVREAQPSIRGKTAEVLSCLSAEEQSVLRQYMERIEQAARDAAERGGLES